MKKITRILSFFLALLLGMSCLTACGGNTQDTQGSGYYYQWPFNAFPW